MTVINVILANPIHVAKCIIAGVLLLGSCASQGRHPSTSTETALQTASASPRQASAAILINKGSGVGLLRLGDSRERTLELFPKKPNYDEEYTYDKPCPRTEIHWLDIDPGKENGPVSNGVFIYLKEGRVVQIEAATPRYRTPEGITEGSSPEDIRRYYPELKAYVLLNSGAEVVGGRDLIYWVDRKNGIAFELYYDSKVNKRRVRKIIVFNPANDFQPEGCLATPEELQELKPFALEPSSTAANSVIHSSLHEAPAKQRQQMIFAAEEPIHHRVKVPEDVLQILRSDKRNRRRLEEGQSPDDIPASWFTAAETNLNDDGLADLVVMAANPRLFGANIVPIWVFRNTPQGYRLALNVNTLGLRVLKSKTKGYRNIETAEATAREVLTTTYAFDGSVYKELRSSHKPIG